MGKGKEGIGIPKNPFQFDPGHAGKAPLHPIQLACVTVCNA